MSWFDIGLGRPKRDGAVRLGPIQAAVLRVVRDHPSDAHSVAIAKRLRCLGEEDVANSQVYVALRRMETRGLVAEQKHSVEGRSKASRDMKNLSRRGRPHVMFTITPFGRRALSNVAANNSPLTDTSRERTEDVTSAQERPSLC